MNEDILADEHVGKESNIKNESIQSHHSSETSVHNRESRDEESYDSFRLEITSASDMFRASTSQVQSPPSLNCDSQSETSSFSSSESANRVSSITSFKSQPQSQLHPQAQQPQIQPTIMKEGKAMGFEDDDATWERFQKSSTTKISRNTSTTVSQKQISNTARSPSVVRVPQQLIPNASRENSKKSIFGDIKVNVSPKQSVVNSSSTTTTTNATAPYVLPNCPDWLPISSIWSSKKSLSRVEVQVTLFACAQILTASNIPSSYANLKRQQAVNDDSVNFKSAMLTEECATPLRVFEVADRVASGGVLEPEIDFAVIGWFLKLVAANPVMCIDESHIVNAEENISSSVATAVAGEDYDEKENDETDLNRNLFMNEKTKGNIEADDILAMTAAKAEADAIACGESLALKGDVILTIIEGTNEQVQSENHDECGGNHIIPVTADMTVNEIKYETLRRYGISDFVDRHDIFGIDQNNNNVILDFLNIPIGALSKTSCTQMKFRILRRKPITWSLPIHINYKDTYRHVSVDSFTTVEQVKNVIAQLEGIDEADNDWAIFLDKAAVQPQLTFDPWSIQNYSFTSKTAPFLSKSEINLAKIKNTTSSIVIAPKYIEPPQEPTFKTRTSVSLTDVKQQHQLVKTTPPQAETAEFRGIGGSAITEMSSSKNARSLKSRLFAGFSGLKGSKDDEGGDFAEEDPEFTSILRRTSFSTLKPNKVAPSIPTDSFVARFYYGNMAFITIRLSRTATTQAAIFSIMEKLMIRDAADDFTIFLQKRKSDVTEKSELEKSQEIFTIQKTLLESQVLYFERKAKIETRLRPVENQVSLP
ncbi:hypothetical protein HK100_004736, partial [Physocladia obscura]